MQLELHIQIQRKEINKMSCKHRKIIRMIGTKKEYFCIAKQKEIKDSDCRGCMLYNPDLPQEIKNIFGGFKHE